MGTDEISIDFDLSDFEDVIVDEAKRVIQENGVDINCPFCEHEFHASFGSNICPHCGKEVTTEFE